MMYVTDMKRKLELFLNINGVYEFIEITEKRINKNGEFTDIIDGTSFKDNGNYSFIILRIHEIS